MTRIALLLPGSQWAVGGAPMRWRALRDALAPLGCVVHEIACDRRAECISVCASTTAERPAKQPIWYHNRKFCHAYADALLERLTTDGVSTIICSGLETFEYVNYFASLGTVRIIYDMHNVEHQLYRDIQQAAPAGSFHAGLFTDEHIAMVGAAEKSAVTSASAVWCCSPNDRLTVLAALPDTDPSKVRVVPNVVPLPPMQSGLSETTPRRACFIGRMDHYPNIIAARLLISEVAPLLANTGSAMPIVIAGAHLGPELGTSGGNIELVCDPPDVGPLLRRGIMLVPLTIGGGSRLKILEAFAAGAVVVSTAKGVEGLDVDPGAHFLAAETGEQFTSAVLALVGDTQQRTRLAAEAWALVRDRYSVRALTSQLTAGDDL
jgi:glycosyltransferase involved in cell wall biosynthesis